MVVAWRAGITTARRQVVISRAPTPGAASSPRRPAVRRATGWRRVSRSILIIRLSAIGDVVMASPLIDALRRAHPDAHIAWLAQPDCAALLEAHPGLDEVIVWPRGLWVRLWRERRLGALWREVRRLRRELRARRFDLALDLQGLAKSGLPARLSGARERVGLGSREGSALLMTRVLPRGGDPRVIGSEYRFLAESLGLPLDGFAMRVALEEADRAFARDLLRQAAISGGYAVVCPFTTRPQKHWLEDRWGELIPRLRAELGLPVVVLGGPGDRDAAARIVAAAGAGVVDAVGRTTLRQAGALIEGAALLVGVDTGLTHMGVAFAVPTVALFGSTVPYLDTGRESARVLYHRLECSPCRRSPTCGGRYDCMRAIETGEVLAAARRAMRADAAA